MIVFDTIRYKTCDMEIFFSLSSSISFRKAVQSFLCTLLCFALSLFSHAVRHMSAKASWGRMIKGTKTLLSSTNWPGNTASA